MPTKYLLNLQSPQQKISIGKLQNVSRPNYSANSAVRQIINYRKDAKVDFNDRTRPVSCAVSSCQTHASDDGLYGIGGGAMLVMMTMVMMGHGGPVVSKNSCNASYSPLTVDSSSSAYLSVYAHCLHDCTHYLRDCALYLHECAHYLHDCVN